MRPREFVPLLLDWICADQQVRARSFADAAYTACPTGVQVWLPTRAVVHLQPVGAYPLGIPAAPTGPVLPVAPAVTLPDHGQTPLSEVERWLEWRITSARSPQIERVELFHARPPQHRATIPHGAGVVFHSGDRIWIYFRHATPAGRPPGAGPAWRAQPLV